MKQRPDSVGVQNTSYNTAASGAASVISIAAVAGNYNVIDWIVWSYAGTPTSGSLTVQDTTNNTTKMKFDITAGGPGEFVFGARGLVLPVNSAVTITLADGSATKHLTVQYR